MIDEILNNYRERLEHLERIEKPIYDAGSWVPAFQGSIVAGTFTYAANGQVGRYMRIGTSIFIRGYIEITAIPVAPTGVIRIIGVPILPAVVTNLFGVVQILPSNFNYSAGAIDLGGYIPVGFTMIQLVESFDNAPAVDAPAANFTNVNCALMFAGQYQIN